MSNNKIQSFLFCDKKFTHKQARQWLDNRNFVLTKLRPCKEGDYIKYTVGNMDSDKNCKIYNVEDGIFYKK